MFTEINLTINADVKTSTGGTLNGAKLKIAANTQGLSGTTYSCGGCAHETQGAEDDTKCEGIKIVGLHGAEGQAKPGTPPGEQALKYYDYFGLNITVADFADLDTEAKRIALVKTELAAKLTAVEGVTVLVTDIV